MTIKQTNITIIDHNQPPYKNLESLTEFDKKALRKIDQQNMDKTVPDYIRMILSLSNEEFRILTDHQKNQTIVFEDDNHD